MDFFKQVCNRDTYLDFKDIEIEDIEKKAQYISKILNESVAEALEKKRKLGQYAVVWDGEKVVRILPTDKPKTPAH